MCGYMGTWSCATAFGFVSTAPAIRLTSTIRELFHYFFYLYFL